jgi:microcystin-dependent protein
MGISAALSATGAVPVGVVNPFAGANAPAGWLLCFGQTISRTQYPVLFSTLGTTYGAGDGSTTFAIPDMRGRAVAGKDDMGGTAASRLTSTILTASNTLGATGGAQTATIASGNLPVHTHSINHDHGAFNTTGGEGNHTHYTQGGAFGGSTPYLSGWNTEGAMRESSTAGAHNHSIDLPAFSGTSGDGGFANTALTNTQPTIVLNYIIKAQ